MYLGYLYMLAIKYHMRPISVLLFPTRLIFLEVIVHRTALDIFSNARQCGTRLYAAKRPGVQWNLKLVRGYDRFEM